MFRRIERIQDSYVFTKNPNVPVRRGNSSHDRKWGLCGFYVSMNAEQVDLVEKAFACWEHMPGPSRKLNKNCKFFFTEKGWEKYGRPTANALLAAGIRYKVVRIKENEMDIMYKDDVQVALRPKKKEGRKKPLMED